MDWNGLEIKRVLFRLCKQNNNKNKIFSKIFLDKLFKTSYKYSETNSDFYIQELLAFFVLYK